jgi:hypothetical protein
MRDGATTESSSDRIVFQMEVDPKTEPISGSLRRGEHEHSFVGWVALAGALERILKNEETNDRKESVK